MEKRIKLNFPSVRWFPVGTEGLAAPADPILWWSRVETLNHASLLSPTLFLQIMENQQKEYKNPNKSMIW